LDYYFIGGQELATAFRFVGVDGSVVRSPEETRTAFEDVTGGRLGECRILILTEQVSMELGQALTDWQLAGKYPLVVELPGIAGHAEGRKTLVESIREAIGISV
jgi:V/A-type H+-transporting ATPase subunit F